MLISNLENFSMNKIKAKVGLYEGSTLVTECTCSGTQTALQEFDVIREGDQGKFFGFGISQKLNLTLIDLNRVLNLSGANSAIVSLGDGETFDNPYPTFYFAEVDRDEKSNSIKATAYDGIYKASARLYSELNINTPYTLNALAQACATLLGVSLKIEVTDGSFDLEYTEGGNFDGDETLRAVLNYIAEVTQTIYFLNSANELVFKRLNRDGFANLSIGRTDYYELTTKTNRTLTAICNTTELGDNVDASTGADGVTQYVRDNPLWELRADLSTLLEAAVSKMCGITLNQFECDWSGNYLLEIGDKISLATEDGGSVTSYVICDTHSYDGAFTQTTSWNYTDNSNETESNPTNIGDAISQTFAKVDKVNKEIELLASDIDEQSQSIAQLKITTSGINASVSSLETKTQSSMDNLTSVVETLSKDVGLAVTEDEVSIVVRQELQTVGVDKVVTESKKYTFDDEGLSISSSSSSINTQITEDGMTIKRGNSTVLTANNEGVKAEDLHATTYLIIGDTSRLEDYKGRTTCFWIGG